MAPSRPLPDVTFAQARPFRRGPLYFTAHAARALKDRRISWKDVRNALQNQLSERPGTHDLEGTIVITGTDMKGWPLDVVVEEEDRTRVVSAGSDEYPRVPRSGSRRRPRRRQ
jgi:Domain of unknown function (DUF4258)